MQEIFMHKKLFVLAIALTFTGKFYSLPIAYSCTSCTTDLMTDLMKAIAARQSPTVISQIISRGADVNAVDSEFLRKIKPVLRYALDRGYDDESVEIIKMLIAAGADVNQVTYNRVTDKNVRGMMPLLTYAAIYSSAEIVQILVDAGAQDKIISESDECTFKETALTIAKKLRKSAIVKVLEQIK